MLGVAFSFVMLGFGGAGGLINMSYQLDATIHNTQWITGHFHLIFGGAIVIMYFVIAYDFWPHLTGRALTELRLMRGQLWTWFIGMIVTDLPVALGRHSRHAAPDGVFRLLRPGDRGRRRSPWVCRFRRRHPGCVGCAVPYRAGARTPCAGGRPQSLRSALAVHPPRDVAGRAQ